MSSGTDDSSESDSSDDESDFNFSLGDIKLIQTYLENKECTINDNNPLVRVLLLAATLCSSRCSLLLAGDTTATACCVRVAMREV